MLYEDILGTDRIFLKILRIQLSCMDVHAYKHTAKRERCRQTRKEREASLFEKSAKEGSRTSGKRIYRYIERRGCGRGTPHRVPGALYREAHKHCEIISMYALEKGQQQKRSCYKYLILSISFFFSFPVHYHYEIDTAGRHRIASPTVYCERTQNQAQEHRRLLRIQHRIQQAVAASATSTTPR